MSLGRELLRAQRRQLLEKFLKGSPLKRAAVTPTKSRSSIARLMEKIRAKYGR